MTGPEATFPPPDAGAAAGAGSSIASPAESAPDAPLTWIRPPRAGELSIGWRVVTACLWIAVAGAFAAIWNTSERLGLSTWWLGPRGEPMPVFVRLLPFVAPTAMVVAASYNTRGLWRWGVLASLVTAGFGLGDIGGFSGLSGLELAVAGAALVVSLASATGTYRPAHDGDAAEPR